MSHITVKVSALALESKEQGDTAVRLHNDTFILVTSRLFSKVPSETSATLTVTLQINHQHTGIPRIQMSLKPVILHHLLHSRSDMLTVVLTVQTLTDNNTHLCPTLTLTLTHCLFGPLQRFRSVQPMQINSTGGRVFVVSHKDPISSLLVETFHVHLVRMSFVAELLGTVTVALGVGIVRLVEAFGHEIAFGASLVAEVHVVGIVLVDLVVCREFVVGSLGGGSVLRLRSVVCSLWWGLVVTARSNCCCVASSSSSASIATTITTAVTALLWLVRRLLSVRATALLLSSTTLVLLPPSEGLFGKALDLSPVLLNEAYELVHDCFVGSQLPAGEEVIYRVSEIEISCESRSILYEEKVVSIVAEIDDVRRC